MQDDLARHAADSGLPNDVAFPDRLMTVERLQRDATDEYAAQLFCVYIRRKNQRLPHYLQGVQTPDPRSNVALADTTSCKLRVRNQSVRFTQGLEMNLRRSRFGVL
ncbi:hypothetical protein WJX72_000012 [[Myrmecia] bisecta]|uniref:Uncharacterized protein n=1 Tax=[Myrmecia] bisecta TaxID=41462 RepID=A0AAW1PRH6_9CHLO